MSKLQFFKEIVLLVVFIALLVLLLNPFSIYMPTEMMISIISVVTVLFGLFFMLVFREQGKDERELAHAQFAGRTAFLSAGVIALIGLFWQAFYDTLDPWLVGVVGAMALAKVASLIYAQTRR